MSQLPGRPGHGNDGRSPKGQGPKGPNKGPGVKPPHIPGKTAGFWVLLLFLVFLVYQMIALDHTTDFINFIWQDATPADCHEVHFPDAAAWVVVP